MVTVYVVNNVLRMNLVVSSIPHIDQHKSPECQHTVALIIEQSSTPGPASLHKQQLTSVSYWVLQEAPAAGIPVHQRSLGSAEVKACMMSNLYLMLMLVDKSKLCSWSSAWGNSAYSDKHSYTGAHADNSIHSTDCM